MKILNILLNLFSPLLFLTLLTTSCQKEIEELDPIDVTKIVTTDAPLFSLLDNVSLLDGSFDDVLDGSRCLSIQLPATIAIDTLVLTVSSEVDFISVRNALKLYDLKSEDIVFEFPVTVLLADFSKVIIDNKNQLDELVSACDDALEDDDIECIDINYPISIHVFNSLNELLITVEINSDMELNTFLKDRDSKDLISIRFPIALTISEGSVIMVNDNLELQNMIELSEDVCDEEDDFVIDELIDGLFIQYLTSDSWVITLFYDKENLTDNYMNYGLDFYIDGSIDVSGAVTEGSWQTGGDITKLIMTMDFDNNTPLKDLNLNWDILESSESLISMGHTSGGTSSSEFLILESAPRTSDSQLEIILKSTSWYVDSYMESGSNNTGDFTGWTMEFLPNNLVSVSDTNESFSGVWLTVNDAYFILDFTDSPFDKIRDQWIVTEFDASSLTLEIPNEGGDPDILVLKVI